MARYGKENMKWRRHRRMNKRKRIRKVEKWRKERNRSREDEKSCGGEAEGEQWRGIGREWERRTGRDRRGERGTFVRCGDEGSLTVVGCDQKKRRKMMRMTYYTTDI